MLLITAHLLSCVWALGALWQEDFPGKILTTPTESDIGVTLTLDKSGPSPVYVPGERMTLGVSVKQQSYLYVFLIGSGGQVAVLVPNGEKKKVRIKPGASHRVPQGSMLFASGEGKRQVLVLATKQPIDLRKVVVWQHMGGFAGTMVTVVPKVLVTGPDQLRAALIETLKSIPGKDWGRQRCNMRSSLRPRDRGTLLIRLLATNQ